MRRVLFKAVFLMTLLAVGLVGTANAAPIVIVSRAALGGDDFFDWGNLGPDFTSVANPFNLLSDGSTTTATVENPSGGILRLDQGGGWTGNFANGDELIFTEFTVGPLDISFDIPVFGAGAQIQRNDWGAFTARLQVFDTSNVLIGDFILAGNSSGDGDNTAIFLGALDTVASIGRISYSVDTLSEDFAINQLDIVSGPAVPQPAIPEPASLLLLGTGLAAAVCSRRRRS